MSAKTTMRGRPQLCDGKPITDQQNLNKLLKGLRQQRIEKRGFRVPHTRQEYADLSRTIRRAAIAKAKGDS